MKTWANRQAIGGFLQICCIYLIAFGDKSFGESPVYDSSGRPWYENGGTKGSNEEARQNVSSQWNAAENAGFSYPSEAAKQQDLASIDSMLRGLQEVGAADPSHPQHQAYLLALDGRQRAVRTPVNQGGNMGAYGNGMGPQDALSLDGLRQQIEENTQQRAQQQMAADNAKYAAIRERGARQLGSAVKGALAELDAIDAAESGSRRSSVPERVRPSADQLKMNAMKEALSDVYEGLAGDQWSSPSTLEYRTTESEGDDPDSLLPPVQDAPYSDYGPLANGQSKNPAEMTPRERTQLYTEVDKAFHEKYPEYGKEQIDPVANPDAAQKWLEERDQILASRSNSTPVGMAPHETTQLHTEVDKAFHEKYPEYGEGQIDPATNPEAAAKWLNERDQILASRNATAIEGKANPKKSSLQPKTEQASNENPPESLEDQTNPATHSEAETMPDAPDQTVASRSEPAATENATRAGSQPASPHESKGHNDGISETSGEESPLSSNSSDGDTKPLPSSSEAVDISPQSNSASVIDSAGLEVKPQLSDGRLEISSGVSVDPATGDTTAKSSIKVQDEGYGLEVGKSLSESGQTSTNIGVDTPYGSVKANYQDSSTATSVGIGLEEKKEFKLPVGSAALAAEANGTIKGNKVIPSEDPYMESAFYKSVDISGDISLSASAKLADQIGVGVEVKGSVVSGSHTFTRGSDSLNIYAERQLTGGPDSIMYQNDGQQPLTREFIQIKRDAARATANKLCAQGQTDAASRYFSEYHKWDRQLNNP